MLTILLLCLFILGVDDQRCLELTMEGKIIRPQMISTGRRWIAFGGKHLYYPNSLSTFRLLKLSGDIEINPGPSRPPTGRNQRWKYPCGECLKPVKNNQNGVLCGSCSQWFHVKCKLFLSGSYGRRMDLYGMCFAKLIGFLLREC